MGSLLEILYGGCCSLLSFVYALAFLLYLRGERGGKGIYVIKEWHVTKQANASGNFVQINGRQEGLIAWFLALFNIDPTVRISVSQRNFTLEVRVFYGFLKRVIPLVRVSEIRSSFSFPWFGPVNFVIFALFCFFTSLYVLFNNGGALFFLFMLLLTVVFLGLAVFIYVHSRSLELGVVGSGGNPAVIRFKPSFIEGKRIEAAAAEEVSEIIHELIDMRQEGEAQAQRRKEEEKQKQKEEESRKWIMAQQEQEREKTRKRIEAEQEQERERARKRKEEEQERNLASANTTYKEAKSLFKAGQFDGVMMKCNAVLDTIPHAHTFLLRAMLWEKYEKYKEMLEDCTRAIDLDPNMQNAYWVRATAFKCLIETSTWNRRQRRDSAVADLSKITPDHRYYAQAQNLIQELNSYF